MLHAGDTIFDNHVYIDGQIADPIILLICTKKGFHRGRKGTDRDHGMWILGKDIKRILNENPDWIRTKIIAKKFGL